MTNTIKLKQAIKKSGYKIGYIAKELNLTRPGLSSKINNKSKFNTSEMFKLGDLLDIPDDGMREIFFTGEVSEMETNDWRNSKRTPYHKRTD